MTAYLLAAGLAALLTVGQWVARLWWGKRKAEQRADAAEVDARVATGRAEVAEATVEVAREVAGRQEAGRSDADAVRAEASREVDPLAKIAAADAVRRKIAAGRRR